MALRRAFDRDSSERGARILVLGAPVGYPACFDTYLHYDIELMLSGPEVAASLRGWMEDHDGRRRAEVFRVAERRKEELMGDGGMLLGYSGGSAMRNMVVRVRRQGSKREDGEDSEIARGVVEDGESSCEPRGTCRDETFESSSPTMQSQC